MYFFSSTRREVKVLPLVVVQNFEHVLDEGAEQWNVRRCSHDAIGRPLRDLGEEGVMNKCIKVLKPLDTSHYITLNHPLVRTMDDKGVLLGLPHALYLRQKVKRENKPINVHWSLYRPSLSGLQELNKLVSEKKVKPVIDSVFSLKDINLAHDKVGTGHSSGKVVIEM